MRRFPLRLFILIVVITALTGSSLAVQEVDLSVGGVSLQRGDDTLLGLQLGLDLEGGSRLVYQALPTEGESPTQEQMEGVIRTIERRVNAFGVAEPVIQTMGGDRVQVQLPGVGTTEATLTFQQDVQVSEIREVLAAQGRQDSTIDQQDSRNFVVEMPSLRPAELDEEGNEVSPSERDAIEQALRERFPVVTLSLTLDDATSEDNVRAAMAAAGREGVEIRAVTDTIVSVGIPGLRPAELDSEGNVVTPSEEDGIRATLQQELPSLASVELLQMSMVVSGGVEEAKRLIGQTAQLELMERTCTNDPQDFTQDCDDPEYHVDSPLNLSGEDLVRAYAGTHPTSGLPVVNLEFDSEGGRIFAQHTQRIAGTGNRTAFFLDDEFLIAPVALQAITGGRAFIQGPDFTIDRVRTISIQLESGRLQVPLVLIQEQDVDATLGEDSLQRAWLRVWLDLAWSCCSWRCTTGFRD